VRSDGEELIGQDGLTIHVVGQPHIGHPRGHPF
jgi:hypothetical protein